MIRRSLVIVAALIPVLAPATEVRAELCRDYRDEKAIDPTTSYEPDSPKFELVVSIPVSAPKAEVTFLWFAEDVGTVAPPNTKLGTTTLTGTKDSHRGKWWQAAGTLSRPTAGWPVGQYRVEVLLNSAPLTIVRFTVKSK